MILSSGRYIDTKRGYKFFLPISLPEAEKQLKLDRLQGLLDQANLAIGELRALDLMLPNPELLTERYAIKEALLSSQIEGTQSTLMEIFENKDKTVVGNDIKEVRNYFEALNYGIETLKEGKLPLSLRLIRECHNILMDGVRGGEVNKMKGRFRVSQNWIGGTAPADAKFVPPPAEEVFPLMGDLEKYIYYGRSPNLVKAALLHYQFETIHPFLDGNGRIGRLLIPLFLISSKILNYPTLYLSLYLKKMKLEYYDLLMDIRNSGNYERWIKFFLEGIIKVSGQIMATTNKIIYLEKADQELATTKNEHKLLQVLFKNPAINIKGIQHSLSISNNTANSLTKKFEKIGILRQSNKARRNKKYIYAKYMEIIEAEL
jgi:Fic family protein